MNLWIPWTWDHVGLPCGADSFKILIKCSHSRFYSFDKVQYTTLSTCWVLETLEKHLFSKTHLLPSVGRQDMHAKQVTLQWRVWILATVSSDHVHLDIDWQLKLNMSKVDLPLWVCPPAPSVFFPTPWRAAPFFQWFRSRAWESCLTRLFLSDHTHPNYRQSLLVLSSKYI